MALAELTKQWSNATGIPLSSMKIAEKYRLVLSELDDLIPLENMNEWKIRACDRKDFADWMPCRLRDSGTYLRIYYVNVNPNSKIHQRSLSLAIYPGKRAQIDEWDGLKLISSLSAKVDKDEQRPTEEEIIRMTKFAEDSKT